MKKTLSRIDDFNKRSLHLQNLSDEELKEYFWDLANKATIPLIDLAKNYTSVSIERSILMRMGFSSLEAKEIVEKVLSHEMISKGAGGVVYRYAKLTNKSIHDAGLDLLNDNNWDILKLSLGRD